MAIFNSTIYLLVGGAITILKKYEFVNGKEKKHIWHGKFKIFETTNQIYISPSGNQMSK